MLFLSSLNLPPLAEPCCSPVQTINDIGKPVPCPHLIVKLPVLILAEQGGADAGQSVRLAYPQSLFKGVVQLDLAAAADDEDSAGTVIAS